MTRFAAVQTQVKLKLPNSEKQHFIGMQETENFITIITDTL